MFHIPGEQVIHALNSCDGNVQCICGCVLRDNSICNQSLRQRDSFRIKLNFWNGLNHRQPSLNGILIALIYFLQNNLRDKQIEVVSTCLPLFLRQLLVGRRNDVAAGTRRKITDNGCFEVDFWFHYLDYSILEYSAGAKKTSTVNSSSIEWKRCSTFFAT